MIENGQEIPPPRSLADPKADPPKGLSQAREFRRRACVR